jgi:hypothetical protein
MFRRKNEQIDQKKAALEQQSLYDQRAKDILEEYYQVLDSSQFCEELLLKYYAPDCAAIFTGLPPIQSRQLVTRALAVWAIRIPTTIYN